MLLEVLLFLILGIFAGVLTGLLPGIHINLIGALLVTASASFLAFLNPIYLVVFIVAMSITHVFTDFIPSIFLGAPEEGTELSVLPGHDMLAKGLGLQAIHLTSLGCLYGVFLFFLMSVPLFFLVDEIYDIVSVSKFIPFFLIFISLGIMFMEKKKVAALFTFIFCGALGLITLNLGLREPLLPLLTGLFGASGIVLSLSAKTKLTKQNTKLKVGVKKLKPLLTSALVSPLSIFFPALSSGQLATIGNFFSRLGKKEFLFTLGCINSLGMAFSFLALALLAKTRTGSAVAVQSLLGVLDLKHFIFISTIILISGTCSFFLTKLSAKKFLIVLEKINYTKVSISVLLMVSAITFLVSGFPGLLVLAVSTLTGIYCISLGVSRVNMMGCLLLPTIVLYLF